VGSQKPDIVKGNLYEGKMEFPDWQRGALIQPRSELWEAYGYFLKQHILFLWVRGLSDSNQ